ncbi:MAG: PTS sugar transporter subunit IIA [Anaerolineae bacterium]
MVTLLDLLNAKTIRLSLAAADWREATRLAGSLLLKTGVSTPVYVEATVRVVEELGPCMNGVKQTCTSLVRLASPIEFGSESNDPVDLVFAFWVMDKEEHL